MKNNLDFEQGEVKRKLRIKKKWQVWIFRDKERRIKRIYGRNFNIIERR